jgi:PAS domain S-box-containing protein
MRIELTPYMLAQAASAIISLFAAVVAWRRRAAPGGTVFALMMTCIAIWTTAVSLEEGMIGVPSKILFAKISYIGAVNVAPLFLLFARHFLRVARRIRSPVVLLLWAIPAAVFGLAVTNEWHGLVWSSVQLAAPPAGNLAVYGHGPAWWIMSLYDFALVMFASGYIGKAALGTPRVFRRQRAIILAAVAVVWAGFAAYIAPGNPFPGFDMSALSFSIAGLLLLWGLTRGKMLALSPIARDMLMEAMPDGLIVEDARGRVIDANPVALSLLRKDSSIIGSPLERALEEWPDLAAAMSHARDGGKRIIRREALLLELTVSALRGLQGEHLGRMVTLRDISDQHRAEEAIEANERNLQALLSDAQRHAKELELLDQVRTSLAIETELPVIFRTVVEGISRTFGYAQVSLYVLQEDTLVLQHQVGYSRVLERIPITQGIMGRVLRAGTPVLVEDVSTDPDFLGAIEGLVSEVCVPFFDKGRPVGTLNVESSHAIMGEADLRLITVLGEHLSIAFAKARLYAEARDNEERYRTLVATLGEGVGIVDLTERFVFANPAAELVFGVPPGQLMGRSLSDFLGQAELELTKAETRKRLEGISSTYEITIHRPDGEIRQIELIATPHHDENGKITGTLGVFRDVTDLIHAEEERARLQEQLQQSQKMEAVGRLAGGIAHDFNNILTVITGYCELAIEDSSGNPALESNVQEIKSAARRASELISQLLAFSRRQIMQAHAFEMGELVEGMESMLRRLLGEDISLRTFRASPSLYVHADPGRVEQIIMNLAVNSRDAMPGGGVLTIRTDAGRLPPEETAGHPDLNAGEYVVLSVSDTGHGMDQATLARLFEPFFTTKEVGKGTGLGLATVYGIIRQSSGHITCRSEVDSGTTFTIYLPRTTREAAHREAIEQGAAEPRRGTESILLVEDDEPVRHFVTSVLETAGYIVAAADSGSAALEKFDSLVEPPRLLLTDVIMPGMDGRVLAKEVTGRSPGIRLLFMSGYAETASNLPGPPEVDFQLIQKPFSAGELLRKVRETLDRPALAPFAGGN